MAKRAEGSALADDTVPAREGGPIGSLQNGLDVFDMFSRDHMVVTVTEIARHLSVHKSSASRIAATLVGSGFLRPAANGAGFQLGGKLARLGSLAIVNTTLVNVSEPILRELSNSCGETCHIGVLDANEAVTVALLDGSFAVRLHSWVGKRSAAHLTAMGKVLLAGLSDSAIDRLYPHPELEGPTRFSITTVDALKANLAKVKKQGYALDNEELEIGLRCVATPIRNHDNRVVASLTIAGSASRIQMSTIDAYIDAAKTAAQRISLELGAPAEDSRTAA